MRQAGQFRGGFYPVPPEAVTEVLRWLRPPEEPFTLLDPCAGQSAALLQFGRAMPTATLYAVELDEDRAEASRIALESVAGRGLLPASFLGTNITAGSFSLVWCNPPYDNEIGGGGRVEVTFLAKANRLLRTGGIMALAVPEHVTDKYECFEVLQSNYDNLCRFPYPEGHRQYGEVVVLGRKRSKPRDETPQQWNYEWQPPREVYQIPPCGKPAKFEKSELTEAELERYLERSPLLRYLTPPAPTKLPSPPLALGTGHRALLLASGQLDGIVRPPGEPPHVVRGVSYKSQYVASCEDRVGSDGSISTTTVYSERLRTTVRAVGPNGIIKTFGQAE